MRRTEGDILQVRKLAQEAIELDPEYGDAYLMLGWTHLEDIFFYRTNPVKNQWRQPRICSEGNQSVC